MQTFKLHGFLLLNALAFTHAQTTTSCPLADEVNNLSPSQFDKLDQALTSALASFEQNSMTSAANAAWSSALQSAPSSVALSLYCSGYAGIDLSSLPPWLTSVPTPYVSAFIQEQAVYLSIVDQYIAETTASETVSSAVNSSNLPNSVAASTSASSTTASSASGAASTSGASSSSSHASSTSQSSVTSTKQPTASPSTGSVPKLVNPPIGSALAVICLALAQVL